MLYLKLWLAFLLDLLLGDPPRWPHPVRALGRLITWLEPLLRQRFPDPRQAGVALAVICLSTTAILVSLIRLGAQGLGGLWLWIIDIMLLYWALALKDLADHAWAVYLALEAGDLPQARQALARIVGRDTAALSEAGVIRATVETVAENTVDGVLSPLFYGALAGPLGAWLFKTVSTLDSMVGYKNERYRDFGWASARLDDLANWLPARLSWPLFLAAAALLERNWREVWRTCRQEARKHPSPNAGWPEAAISGALGLRLGGPSYYQGQLVAKPWIGSGDREPNRGDILSAIQFLYLVGGLAAFGCGLLNLLLYQLF